MKVRNLLILVILALISINTEARTRRRRPGKQVVNRTSKRSNRKAKISVAACARRCNKKSGCGKKKPPTNVCDDRPVDIVMVLDGSSSVGHKNFTIVKDFMSSIVESFSVKEGGVRVALHQYSSERKQKTEFTLSQYNSKEAVINAIQGISWITGDTYTAAALNTVRRKIIEPAHKEDPERARMILVITDGDPQDFKNVDDAVTALKPFDVKIFAIGVGDATVPELKRLAWTGPKSNARDYIYADDYAQAQQFKHMIVKQICE